MNANTLKLNGNKTEAMVVGTRNVLEKVIKREMEIDDSKIKLSKCVKNLGVFMDNCLTMYDHTNNIMRATYANICNVIKINNMIP